MPKVRLPSIYIDKELDERLRNYIHRRFKGHVHGKITQVVVEALEKFLTEAERKVS
jgi:hypothetical protein